MPSLTATVGPYRVIKVLGQGAIGAVYQAQNLKSGREVALKTVETPWAALLPLIRREIHALGRLRHPGVVQILDSGTQEGVPWYAMELIEGPTLREHARTFRMRRPSELMELLSVTRRLCSALAYVHGEGIVHRDLKPDNVLVREILVPPGPVKRRRDSETPRRSMPVLVDFGLVAEWPGALGRENLAAESTGVGTPVYSAPEQLRGEMVDARADLYSLGCMLYELLGGRPPFEGTVRDVVHAHLHVDPRPLSQLAPWVSPELEALVLRLLAKDRRQRLGYAADVSDAL